MCWCLNGNICIYMKQIGKQNVTFGGAVVYFPVYITVSMVNRLHVVVVRTYASIFVPMFVKFVSVCKISEKCSGMFSCCSVVLEKHLFPCADCCKHRRSEDFVLGVHFSSSKKLTTFLCFFSHCPHNTCSNYLNHFYHRPDFPSFLKNWTLSLPLGCILCPGVHLQLFPVNLPPLQFFLHTACGCAPSTPLAMPMCYADGILHVHVHIT